MIITPQAHLLHFLNSVFPGFITGSMELINRVLPGPRDVEGDRLKSGWESRSKLSPSVLTRRADQAAVRNNELPPPGSVLLGNRRHS